MIPHPARIVCYVRGLWRTLLWSNSFPIDGCTFHEQSDGSLVCAVCKRKFPGGEDKP